MCATRGCEVDGSIAELREIDGGFHVKDTSDGRHCIDVMIQLYNWRLVLSPKLPREHEGIDAAYCYFGHGVDAAGQPRDMGLAFLRAVAAAQVWDGVGDPVGYDKKAWSA